MLELLIGGAVFGTLVYFGVIKGSVAVPGVGTLNTPGNPAQGLPDPNFNASVAAQGRIAVGDVVSVPAVRIVGAFSETEAIGNGPPPILSDPSKLPTADANALNVLDVTAASGGINGVQVKLLVTAIFPQGVGTGLPGAAIIGVMVDPKLVTRIPFTCFESDVVSITRGGKTIGQSAS